MSEQDILVVGHAGQLGFELMRASWPAGARLHGVDHQELDIRDRAAVLAHVAALRPRVIVNAAAYTAVDKAETERDLAFAVNQAGAAHLAEAASAANATLLHYSTDYVFDGSKAGAYIEQDHVSPLNVYGASKEAGERAVRERCPKHLILRTSWVYGVHGANFVKTMLRLGKERDLLRVVADQVGAPTAAVDIAAATTAVVSRVFAGGERAYGTFHFTGGGETSWFGFADAIFDAVASRGEARPKLEAIPTSAYPTPARRPLNSRLDCTRVYEAYGVRPRPWRDALTSVLTELFASSPPKENVR